MVLRQVPSHIPGGGAGEHQQGVDDQQAHPGHGDGHHHGDGGGKEEVFPDHPDAPAVSQGLVNGREHHLVKGSDPQHQQAQQNQSQQADFPGGHTENVADEKVVEFGKALAAQGAQKNAQGHGSGGEDTDGRVAGHVGFLPDQGKEQGDDHGEEDRRAHRLCQAAESPNGHAGEGGVPQSVGKEGHTALHHHGGQQTEQRRDHQDCQQGIFHKEHGVRGGPFKGEPGEEPIPEIHWAHPPSSPRFKWKTA